MIGVVVLLVLLVMVALEVLIMLVLVVLVGQSLMTRTNPIQNARTPDPKIT